MLKTWTCIHTHNSPLCHVGLYGAGLLFNATHESGVSRTLSLANCTLRDNAANKTGGGLYVGSGLTAVTLNQLIMVNNSAGDGGALVLEGNSDINISNCDFHSNSGTNACMAMNAEVVLMCQHGSNYVVDNTVHIKALCTCAAQVGQV